MSTFSKVVRVFAVALTAVAFTQVATAQTGSDGNKSMPHMGGGTQPGPGTHGHSSDLNTKEGKEIQQKQHNMPATPGHSGGPATGKPGQ